ncbi:hypothetical protein AB0F17_52925 [Nonomuraea sp. NPDC026600]|uniref:hypothetical protein n=1 Tax=Nonomuraea sp. NPDC026600 TaxID=3155363 RepID=UPI0033E33335
MNRRLLDELNRATTPISRPNPLVVLWRWRYEVTTVVCLPLLAYLIVTSFGPISLAVVAVPAVIVLWPPARSGAWGRIRCVVTAHRIRVGLVEAYVVNRRGKIPVIVWCAPAPFGERVWVWCRAGTTPSAIGQGRDVIAAACWASEVVVRPRSGSPHWVLLEVIRQGRSVRTLSEESRSARGTL